MNKFLEKHAIFSRIHESQLPTKNGMKLFKNWYNEAAKLSPESFFYFCLSTVDNNNVPYSRMMALTGFNMDVLKFSSNKNSHKSKQISSNKHVSMNFFWAASMR